MFIFYPNLAPPPPCPSIPFPENGSVIFFNDGRNAFFICNTCYEIQGPPFLTCKGGKWNLPPPNCEKKC